MTRLPPALRPLWPAAKVSHRAATRVTGRVTRAVSAGGPRSVPSGAYPTSRAAAEAEPEQVRLHIGGPAEHARRAPPSGAPGPLRFWDDVAELRVPERSVLEVTEGRLVGDYAATITPGGVLDLQSSPYFNIRDWTEHPIFLRPRLPEAQRLGGTVLSLASPASGRNYYHALMDTLPRWGVLTEALGETPVDHIVVAHRHPWDRELLEMLGLDRSRFVEPRKHLSVRADRLLVPCLNNQDTLAPRWITAWLRRTLTPRPSVDAPRRLYITRGSRRNTRRFVRETELVAALGRIGFEAFDPGSVSVREQIDRFAAAEVVVAPHGAGLANLNFAPTGVRVLELFAPRYLNPGYWAIVDNIPDAVYRYLVADPVRADRPAARMTGVQNDVDLDPARVLDAVEELLATLR